LRLKEGSPIIEFKGKTDKAIIPIHLLSKLNEIFTIDRPSRRFTSSDTKITLFGKALKSKKDRTT